MNQAIGFVIGQRWASHTEADLGLGIVIELEGRRVTLSFPAVAEIRTYATKDAPLSRIKYAPEEKITNTDDESFIIVEVTEEKGLLCYHCLDEDNQSRQVSELQLSAFVRFSTPQQRLFSGQFGGERSFKLRVETLEHVYQLQQADVQGLLGSRTNLLAHQLYIAHEVSQRHAPRVLLADEVGLGKTIEAGMILHQQILSGKTERVLIIVPESLLHQWLVEMLRRFNLPFAIFDQSRLVALSDDNHESEDEDLKTEKDTSTENFSNPPHTDINPFATEQKIICSLNFLMSDSAVQQQVLQADWDMVIIDEAHHIFWSEAHSSKEYLFAEKLSRQTEGLLLLTATPEQAGIDSHFARLRLLDPDRFNSLVDFKKEAEGYRQINQLINKLQTIEEVAFSAVEMKILSQHLATSNKMVIENHLSDQKQKSALITALLDQYGTGRVLFRNTRVNIKNFPKRQVLPYPLTDTANIYGDLTTSLPDDNLIDGLLFPEHFTAENTWINKDPRVGWLESLLKSVKKEKVLVICHFKETAIALDKFLNLQAGIRSTCFYEGLSILERDRSAAYFSDNETGAQTLICSEIGSEGRNFQFAHHLVLFDLPLNPDLVEQRIGRLDRIGQTETIKIHVPYIENLPQAVMFQWYHNALNIFQKSCAAGYLIYQKYQQELQQQLQHQDDQLKILLESAQTHTLSLMEEFQQGRDRLLELNSCNPKIAENLITTIEAMEKENLLLHYMVNVFDYFGVEHEPHSEGSIIIRPGDHMHQEHFPGLKSAGNTLTYVREIALSREDMEFLSWEHPMVTDVIDIILNTELGNSAVSMMRVKGLAPGTLLLESFYTATSMAPKSLQLSKYLQQKPYRFLFDIKGKNLAEVVPHHKLNSLCQSIKKRQAQNIVSQLRTTVENILQYAQIAMEKQIPEIKKQALRRMNRELTLEKERLITLQKNNSAIRQDEIDYIEQQQILSQQFLDQTEAQLQSIRLIINY